MSGEELRAALELITFGIRDVSPSEPDERMIPTQHSVGSIRKARAALAAPSTPEPSGPTCNFDCDACRAESD